VRDRRDDVELDPAEQVVVHRLGRGEEARTVSVDAPDRGRIGSDRCDASGDHDASDILDTQRRGELVGQRLQSTQSVCGHHCFTPQMIVVHRKLLACTNPEGPDKTRPILPKTSTMFSSHADRTVRWRLTTPCADSLTVR